MDEDLDGWLEEGATTVRSTPRRDEFDGLLAACGVVPPDDAQWAPVARLLELLETRNYDAVAEVLRSFQLRSTRRPEPAPGADVSHSTTVSADSELAGPAWRAYWEQHRRRVLEGFRLAQEAVLAGLDLAGVLPIDQVANYLFDRVLPTLGSLEYRQHVFDRTEQIRAAAGLAPRPQAERPAPGPADESESLSLQMPTVTVGFGDQPFYSEAPLVFRASDAALVRLRDTAEAIVGYTGCSQVEAVAWLLADALPLWPLLALRSQICRWNGSPPHDHRYTIEVGSGLVPPEEVARFYRQQRDKDAWAGLPVIDWQALPRAFTAELLAFVAEERPGVPARLIRDWPGLHRRWRERYPQRPYRNWRAMRETYLRVAQRAQADSQEGDVDDTASAP